MGDYGELFGRMYELELRNNQIRATVKADMTAGVNDGKANKLQMFIDKIFQSFSKNSVALVPITNGLSITKCQTVWVRTRHLMKATAC